MLTTDTTRRHCARCGKDLTDPASRECGVGPICRGKDNHLYAKLIKANLPQASAIVLGTHASDLAEACRDRWATFRQNFIRQFRRSESVTDMRFVGGDFRDCVRDVDWFLSYRQAPAIRTRLITIVEALGYVGLAAVLSGDAAMSPAKVYLKGGFIYLEGKSCKPGFLTMRKIRGIKTPRYRGDKTPYQVHASKAEPFLNAVRRHWPMYEGDLDALLAEAKAAASASPEEKPIPTATVGVRSEDMTVKFPWVQTVRMHDVVSGLKEIPSADRRWDPANKRWTVKLAHLDAVKAVLSKFYEKVEVTETGEETPTGTYTRASGGYGGRRRYSRRRRW